MNEIQRTVLDIFKHFSAVCEELGLRFFLVNGSALGAKKYGGFIPWDDDLDVVMPRKDYEIFLSKAQNLLPQHLFVQNYRTDRCFPFIYTKIRNSDTSFVEASVSHLDINHGIYMDIFPLDGFVPKGKKQIFSTIKLKVLFWFAFCSLNDKSKLKIRIRNSILRFFGFHKKTNKALAKIESYIANKNEEFEMCCNYGDRQGKGCILREWYGKGTDCSFEGISVKIPEKYDEYLTLKYGAWRSDLPESEQKSHHKSIICDTEKSYKEYLNM